MSDTGQVPVSWDDNGDTNADGGSSEHERDSRQACEEPATCVPAGEDEEECPGFGTLVDAVCPTEGQICCLFGSTDDTEEDDQTTDGECEGECMSFQECGQDNIIDGDCPGDQVCCDT